MEENLGVLIKQIRKEKKMTLKTLSEETELSISFLSQLERGKSSATLNSLKKISLALDVNPGFFFNEIKEEGEATSSGAFKSRKTPSPNFTYKDLSDQLEKPAFAPMLITLKPGQNEGESFSHAGQEFLYVLKGELTLQIEDATQTLRPHESVMFDSNQVHYWYNFTNEEVQFLCISYDEK